MAAAVLTTGSISAQIQYALSASLSPTSFGNLTVSNNTLSFSTANINLTTWNSLFLKQYTIANGANQEFDLTSFTGLDNVATAMAHVLAIIVISVGGAIRLSPAGTHPMQWFFPGTATSNYITVNPASATNSGFVWQDDPTTTGTAITGTTGSLRLANASGVSDTVTVAVIGSTT